MRNNLYVTEDYATISVNGGTFLVSKNNVIKQQLPIETVATVVLCGHIQVTNHALEACMEKGIGLTWLSSTGKFFGRLDSTAHVSINKQKLQFLLSDQEEFTTAISAKFIQGKIQNQITILRRYSRHQQEVQLDSEISQMKALRAKIADNMPYLKLMGLEGSAARVYLQGLAKLVVRDGFTFKGRTKRPPKDPFNSMLSFGYTLLMYELYTAILNEGLHPYVGFFHQIRQGHPALASDLMEEWRGIIVDTMVMALVQGNEMDKADFSFDKDSGGVYLEGEARKQFIRQYEKRMMRINQYGDRQLTFRQLLEGQLRKLSKAISEKNPEFYEPVLIR